MQKLSNKKIILITVLAILLLGFTNFLWRGLHARSVVDVLTGKRTVSVKKMNAEQRKFVAKLLPQIKQVNKSIMKRRKHLMRLYVLWHKNKRNTQQAEVWLQNLAKQFRLATPDFNMQKTWQEMFRRVDVVPPSLVLAKAMTSSNWGNSIYAKQGNNFFNGYCFKANCGIKPTNMQQTTKHEFAIYKTPLASIAAYIHNLNTNNVYVLFRGVRWQLRRHHLKLSSELLAECLPIYYQRGPIYDNILATLIHKYQLTQYDTY